MEKKKRTKVKKREGVLLLLSSLLCSSSFVFFFLGSPSWDLGLRFFVVFFLLVPFSFSLFVSSSFLFSRLFLFS